MKTGRGGRMSSKGRRWENYRKWIRGTCRRREKEGERKKEV
jgi:hypothetical protein